MFGDGSEIMLSREEILKTEFFEDFIVLMRNAMVDSFAKYGPVSADYGHGKPMDSSEAMAKCFLDFQKDPNLEHLVDVANYAMIQFKFPTVKGAYYKHDDSGAKHAVGMGVVEIAALAKDFGLR